MAVYEVVLNGNGPFGDLLTVLHYSSIVPPDPPDWDAVGSIFYAQIDANLVPQLATTITYTGITVREDVPGAVGINYPFVAGDLVGTNVDSDLAGQIAVLVRKLANSTQNPNQGRIYQGGITASALAANGRWNPGMLTAVGDCWEALRILNVAGGAQLQMVIKASKPTNPNTVAYNPVDSVVAVGIPATQRRRRETVGS